MTAAVSWILQTYPALGRRRVLAQRPNLFREAAGPEGVSSLEPGHAAGLLESLAESVAEVSIDLMQINESCYFYEPEQRNPLAARMHQAQQLAAGDQASGNVELGFAGRMLGAALEDLAGVLRGNSVIRGRTPRRCLKATRCTIDTAGQDRNEDPATC